MGIEIKIVATDAAELATLVEGLHSRLFVETSLSTGVVVEDKPTRTRRPKAEPEKVEEPAKLPEEPGESAGETVEDDQVEPEVSYPDVQKAVTQLAAAKGRDAVVAVFKEFGVDHGTKLTKEQWAPALQALQDAKEAA